MMTTEVTIPWKGKTDRIEIYEWCADNLRGKYNTMLWATGQNIRYQFEDEQDAVFFALKWS